MTPKEYAAHCRKAAAKISVGTAQAQAETVKNALKVAGTLSSGPHSTAQLRAAGHPYARLHPNPAYAAQIINVQTGRFKNAWASTGPVLSMGILISHVVNTSPEAGFLANGTENMIARPIAQAIADAVQPGYAFALQKVVFDALNP